MWDQIKQKRFGWVLINKGVSKRALAEYSIKVSKKALAEYGLQRALEHWLSMETELKVNEKNKMYEKEKLK